MWPWSEQTLLREQLKAAEARASVAEAALAAERAFADDRQADLAAAIKERMAVAYAAAVERKENRQAERHLVSMWLRHQKSLPLPPTPDEKAEAKAEAEEEKKKPPVLTDVQIAMREANRRDAASVGISEADADEHFMKNLHTLTPE